MGHAMVNNAVNEQPKGPGAQLPHFLAIENRSSSAPTTATFMIAGQVRTWMLRPATLAWSQHMLTRAAIMGVWVGTNE